MIKVVALSLLMGWVSVQGLTFTNPIFSEFSADPVILKVGNYYYLTLKDINSDELAIYKSPILTNFRNVEKKVVYRVPDGYSTVTPSEMLEIDGEIYLHFSMDSPAGPRVYVMKANDPSNPMGTWGEPVRLMNDLDDAAIEGSVMKHNGQLYFVWSNVSTSLSLFIAPMTSPTWVGSPKVLLRQPQAAWECDPYCNIEAATFIYNKNVSCMIYSASARHSSNYCLAQMSIPDGADPLIPANWKFVNDPVFWRNDDEDVYASARAAFTLSPDETETWMVYHASISPVHISWRQTARLEKIEWNGDGSQVAHVFLGP